MTNILAHFEGAPHLHIEHAVLALLLLFALGLVARAATHKKGN